MKWEIIIGLEVHVQLLTKSKMFSNAPTNYGALPNTQASTVDLAMPGVLPALNEEAVKLALKLGFAVNATINKYSVFARKNYFYPDLTKGYQTTQHLYPIIEKGYLDIDLEDDSTKRIGITRAHLEEDTGKSLHEDFHGKTGLDFNRAGTPLLEIVSEPDMRCAKEAATYLKALHTLVCYLGICDGNMQEGSFRCDANVSVRPIGETKLGTRTEMKNLNSFRFVERAIDYEVKRQIETLEAGGTIHQETRLYDSVKNETRAMRTKEDAQDYRYFPEPDLMPLRLTDKMLEQVRITLPELPSAKKMRFMKDYGLNNYDAAILINDMDMANYFEETLKIGQNDPKLTANWILGELLGALNKHSFTIINSPISPAQLAGLLKRIEDNTISGKIAKTIFTDMYNNEGEADEIIEKRGLKQVTDTDFIQNIIQEVLKNHPEELKRYQEGQTKLFGFFIGQIMQATKGKANPKQVNEALKKAID